MALSTLKTWEHNLKRREKYAKEKKLDFYTVAQNAFTAERRSNLKHETGLVHNGLAGSEVLGSEVLGTQMSFNANDRKFCAGIAQQSHSLARAAGIQGAQPRCLHWSKHPPLLPLRLQSLLQMSLAVLTN